MSSLLAKVNAYLYEKNIDCSLEAPLVISRLTESEYSLVSKFSVGHVFSHVNLQHYGIPSELMGIEYQVGVEIVRHGINTVDEHVAPKVNFSRGIVLKLVEFTHSLSFTERRTLINPLYPEGFQLAVELHKKYGKPMGLSLKNIKKMQYYIRVYEVVGAIVF